MTRHHKKNEDIPSFGYKSAFLIGLSAILGSFIIPLLLNKVGITWKLIHVLISGALPAYTTAFSLYFIESDKGYTKRFWQMFIALFVIISFISFFWMYDLLMI